MSVSRRVSALCVITLSLWVCTVLQATAKPVALSMCAISDYTSNQRFDATSALRFQIVSKLVQNYDCLMLSRSMSDCLAFEQEIRQFEILQAGNAGNNATLAADYAIRIHVRHTDDSKGIRVFAIVKDLTHDLAKEPNRIVWDLPLNSIGNKKKIREYGKLADLICAKIAELLKLSPRSYHSQAIPATTNAAGVWAVLPFEVLDATHTRGMSAKQQYYSDAWRLSPEVMLRDLETYFSLTYGSTDKVVLSVRADYDSALRRKEALIVQMEKETEDRANSSGNKYVNLCEVALQHNNAGRIVDRNRIEQVLKELKLRTLLGVNETLGGCISRIAGADRLIMGCVQKESGGSRFLLQLIDGSTSTVLDAADRLCPNEEDMATAIQDIVNEFSRTTWSKPDLELSTKAQRYAEGMFYYTELRYATVWGTAACWIEKLDRLKTAYFLLQDNRDFVAKDIVESFASMVISCGVSRDLRMPPHSWNTQDIADNGAFYLDFILSSFEQGGGVRSPLLLRANAFTQTHYYEKALPLIVTHRKKYPEVDTDEALCLEAVCRYRLGEISEAKRLIQSAMEIPGADLNGPNYPGEARYGNVLDLALTISRDSRVNDERWEYRMLQRYKPESTRFFQLTKQYEGIEKALSLPEGANGGIIPILKGDILFDQGKLEEAAKMYEKYLYNHRNRMVDHRHCIEQLTRINDLAGRTIVAFPTVKDLAEIMALPDKYRIYCYPISGSDEQIVIGVAAKIGAIFGTKVIIQAPVPFPESSKFDKARECYDFRDLARRVLREVTLPEDAVFVYFVTAATFVPANDHYHQSPYIQRAAPDFGNPVFSSQTEINLGCSKKSIIDEMAFRIPINFACSVLFPLPENWDGQGRGEETIDSVKHCDVYGCCLNAFQLCPKCALMYNADNFDKAHKALHAFMKRTDKSLMYYEEH